MSARLVAVAPRAALRRRSRSSCAAIIFQFAGYSALVDVPEHRRRRLSSARARRHRACAGRCRCSSPRSASRSRFAAAISTSARRASSTSARSARPSSATWLNGAPALVLTPLCFLAGIVGGALWALWPGWLRLQSGTDEVITTLMGNFIAGLILVYVTTGPLKDPSGTGQQSSSRPVAAAYRISDSARRLADHRRHRAGRRRSGCGCWSIARRSACWRASPAAIRRWSSGRARGYGGSACRAFSSAARWRASPASSKCFGPNGRLVSGFLPTHGFTAILIALVASLSVVGIAFVGLFFGGLASAALYLPVMAGLPAAAIDIINAAIALFITAKSDWVDRLLRLGRAPS